MDRRYLRLPHAASAAHSADAGRFMLQALLGLTVASIIGYHLATPGFNPHDITGF